MYNIDGSVKRQEKDVVFGGLMMFPIKAEGNTPQLDSGTEAWLKTYVHDTYALAIKITQEAMEDELYGVSLRMAKELSRSAVYTQEVQAMNPFNNPTATAYTANGTNYGFLSTGHFRIDGGTWSNQLASGADLSIESLEALLTQWTTGNLDQRGFKLATTPKKLVVGPTDKWVALRLVNSIQRPFTNDNDVNTIKDLGLEVHVMTHMTDDGRWFLLGETEETGLNWFNRRPVTVQRETDGTGSGNLLITASFRISNGVTHPQNAFGSL